MTGRSTRTPVYRVRGDAAAVRRPDTLAVEEPLEIRVRGRAVSVTMRTPGDDFDLAAGFLLTEGVLTDPGALRSIRYCGGADCRTGSGDPRTYNVVDATVEGWVDTAQAERRTYTTSSCGVCGKASIDAVRTQRALPATGPDAQPRLTRDLVLSLPGLMREAQQVFSTTGGLHAAALFDDEGSLLCLREDVGRHNAVDKVVGWAVRAGRLPLSRTILQVSGRASFELVQKAWMAGIPALSAVSAPSSLAVDLARETGTTLLGFVRPPSFNIYSGGEQLIAPESAGDVSAVAAGAWRPGRGRCDTRRRRAVTGAATVREPVVPAPAARPVAPATGAPLAVLEQVVVHRHGTPVLRDLDLELRPGTATGIGGPNGCGKSTLLDVLATLLRPSAGRARVLGADLAGGDVQAVRPAITLVGHTPAVLPHLTLAENVRLHARLRGLGRQDADRALAEVGLAGAGGRLARVCSAGMLRRADLARALLEVPSLLLLDEVCTGLDASAVVLVDRLVERVTARGGAVVLVSHDADELDRLTDQRLRLGADGRPA